MFARFGRHDGMLGMERVGSDDIDDIDVRIISEPVHRLIVVDVLVRDVVLRLPFLRFGRRAGDDAGEPAVPGFLQRGRNLVGAQAAEAAKGESELFVRISSASFPSYQAGHRTTGGDPGWVFAK